MSRSATAVRQVIKAYDVRGLVGEEIDEGFVADVGAAFARLVRGADRVVIGYDMRESSPALADAFASGQFVLDERFDALVLAVPSPQAVPLLAPHSPVLASLVAEAEQERIFTPQAAYGYFKAAGQGNDIVLFDESGTNEVARFALPRKVPWMNAS